jgi:hypothetical protein
VDWAYPVLGLDDYPMCNSAAAKLPIHINLMTGDTALLLIVVLHDYVRRLVLVKHLLVDFAH